MIIGAVVCAVLWWYMIFDPLAKQFDEESKARRQDPYLVDEPSGTDTKGDYR